MPLYVAAFYFVYKIKPCASDLMTNFFHVNVRIAAKSCISTNKSHIHLKWHIQNEKLLIQVRHKTCRAAEFFTIRSHYILSLNIHQRIFKSFSKKLPAVGIEPITLTITGSKVEWVREICATWETFN